MPWGDGNKRKDLTAVDDPLVDDTELALVGTNLLMQSSVFGFPDFNHLVELQDEGVLRWYGGMTSKEPGAWCIVRGDPNEAEREEDLYFEFTQPLPETYKEAFSVKADSVFWRGKIDVRDRMQGDSERPQVRVEGGIVISEKEKDSDTPSYLREGVWTAADTDEAGIAAQRRKAREAMERALMTPKAETTGFKTPARIAGIRRKGKTAIGPGSRDALGTEDPTKLLTDD